MKKFLLVAILLCAVTPANSADVMPNGAFDSNINGWLNNTTKAQGTTDWDGSVGGASAGSFRYITNSGRRQEYRAVDSILIPTPISSSAGPISLSFYYYKTATVASALTSDLIISIILPDGTTENQLWTNTDLPNSGQVLDGNINLPDISANFSQTGNYYLKVDGRVKSGGSNGATTQFNLDDIVLDVPAAANNAPTVSASATTVSPASVDRIGSNTTTISTTFNDADAPGVGAFNVTFKIREPNNSTELTLVNNQPNGGGGLTITDDGGGDYTASYTYNPDDAQTTGAYDLYFYVSDGTDNVTDGYPDNTDELTITTPGNNVPTVSVGATGVSPTSVDRIGSNTTTISTTFSDSDQPGVGAFNVTFKIREPNNSTELTLVNNQPNGGGGLTITDDGGGDYTASYTYNPDDAQTTGLYDLYFYVSDGTDNVTDDYPANSDELTITTPNLPPTVSASATEVSPTSVDRIGSNTTTISALFTDLDQPGVGAFNVTFKIREPNNSTELTLVNDQLNGGGGLTITDGGAGNYTASYSYNPDDAQTTGVYDLYFYVSDGTDNVTDGYTDNVDELTITTPPVNSAPTIATGATVVNKAQVGRSGTDNVTISCDFTDTDDPGVGAFTVTLKVRRPNNSTEDILVDALTDGNGGLAVSSGGGGSYTASYTWDPGNSQTLGMYDLYCEVSDGTDNAIDIFDNNLDELEVLTSVSNQAPTLTAGATWSSVSDVNRFGTNTTIITTQFSDADSPGINAFTCTFKIREPNNTTELILVNNQTNGNGGLVITDNGGGLYSASFVYDPIATQTLGLYDLYFFVSDGSDNVVDDYVSNDNEMTISETIINEPPVVSVGATQVSVSPVNRVSSNTTVISATFTDVDQHPASAFNCTFKIREPGNVVEVTLVDNQPDGGGGLTITDHGSGVYTASYTYDPGPAQAIGYYDLYFSVTDGYDAATDIYDDNLDELVIEEIIINIAPVISAGATSASPASVDRLGAPTTSISANFTDGDIPGIGEFNITFKVREQFSGIETVIANDLPHGTGGMAISDGGGGNYTATISWNPPDNQFLGYYDLYCSIRDIQDTVTDGFTDNPLELQITNGGENARPIVASDATTASPAAVERIGTNPTTISVTFQDADQPGVGAFLVNFKLREPDDAGQIILATNAAHGTGGVTIADIGGGVYTASVSWEPPDAQTLGYYDLYFDVTDGTDIAYDYYKNNEDELEIYDAISNNGPTLTGGNTFVLPTSINRIGSDITMIKAAFSDADLPGKGAFTITIKVRDQSSTEYTIVNGAKHTEQGLRVYHTGGANYEASVLWNPPDAQTTGTYDLYISITDNNSVTVIDDYAVNGDELTLTSSAIAGDGYLLHRTNDADNCGGPNSACHNVLDHMGQNCRTCHTPHGTTNIYLVRETIQTPNSGPRSVIFKTLGIGDPYNDPDPTVGDPTSGVMADDADNVHTGVCEVCHTTLTRHTNDDSHADQGHQNATDCTSCHPHTEGFPKPEGGAEGSGGPGCGCHSSLSAGMKSTSGTSYHHFIASEGDSYDVAQKTCLMCHVNHDIFRDDLNVGFGNRANNLRVDITTPVVQGDASVLANFDYQSSGAGGICLSCHTSTQTKSQTPPDGSTSTVAISKTDFDAATSTHNYSVPSTIVTGGATFNGTCVKCHTDTQSKQYQDGAGEQFGAHDGPYGRFLQPLGNGSPSDPMEEKHCLGCHSTTQNPNAGSNQDYFGVQSMSTAATRVGTALGYTYAHPVGDYSGRHKGDNETGPDFADGATRHAECMDCHNVHAADQGTHDGSTSLVSNALKGTWGVRPVSWPAAPVPTDNGNVFSAPVTYEKVTDASLTEWMICLKCHSNYTTLPSGARNLAEEINPNYPSTHGITIANQNPYCTPNSMQEPWGSSGITYCSDCHRSSNASDPEGPHGSNVEHLLVATIVSDDAVGTPLCYVCHSEAVYWSSRNTSDTKYVKHPGTQGSHAVANGCFACHMWDYASTGGLGLQTTDDYLNAGQIHVHGMNRKWVYKESDGTAGSGQPADAFVNGYIANIDYSAQTCTAETCKNHDPQSY